VKQCNKCKTVKDLSEFYKLGKGRSSPDGRTATCKQCNNRQGRQWYSGQTKTYHRMSRYGLSEDAYYAMLEAQNYKCALCKSTDPKRKQGFVVDHDHETGRIRGLLCHSCNIALGMLGDDITGLKRAVKYLENNDD
jgi:hypothetical protein